MRSPEDLRAEVRRLHLMLRTTLDHAARQKLAAQALELAQQAEAIVSLPDDVEGLCVRIAQYRHMIADAGKEPNSGLWRNCCGAPRTSWNRSAAASGYVSPRSAPT